MRGKKAVAAGSAVLVVTALVIGVFAYRSIHEAQQTLSAEKQTQHDRRQVAIENRSFTLSPNLSARLLTGAPEIRDACEFGGNIYIATNAGLLVYTPDGKRLERWTTTEGLPSLDLTSVASLQDSLWIGTSDAGLLQLHKNTWHQVLPRDARHRAVTALLATAQGDLFVGTSSGILRMEAGQLHAFYPEQLDKQQITRLAGDSHRLLIGSFNNGIYLYERGTLQQFSREKGLGDPLVTDASLTANGFLVSTPAGLQGMENGRLYTVARNLFVTSFYQSEPSILAATADRGILTITKNSRSPLSPAPAGSARILLRKVGDTLMAFQENRALYMDANRRWKPWIETQGALGNGNASALLRTKNGELWVGTFDHGLDILNAGLEQVSHMQSDTFFCINHLSQDGLGRVYVSTANGLAVVSPDRSIKIYREADGLLSDRVMETLPLDPEGTRVAIATAQGFTLMDKGLLKSLYAFHGLVNNHVYTLAPAGDQIYAGTLGGISRITSMQVTASWTQMDSGLRKNWVNALQTLGDRLLIGTYGGGIQERTASGDWVAFDALPPDLEINQNAFYFDGRMLFCGTAGNGFYFYDVQANRWKQFRENLPGANVTSFTSDGATLYAATDRGILQISYDKLSTIPYLH